VTREFFGDAHNKVDGKGRVSIPASYRRVLQAGDPEWKEGLNPNLVIVYGDKSRNFLECFTMEAIAEVQAKIRKKPRGSKQRRALQRLYNGNAYPTSVDETGRLVLPKKLIEKIGLDGVAYFIANGDTFEIWNPETYEQEEYGTLEADDSFDPNADPSIYLDGDEEE